MKQVTFVLLSAVFTLGLIGCKDQKKTTTPKEEPQTKTPTTKPKAPEVKAAPATKAVEPTAPAKPTKPAIPPIPTKLPEKLPEKLKIPESIKVPEEVKKALPTKTTEPPKTVEEAKKALPGITDPLKTVTGAQAQADQATLKTLKNALQLYKLQKGSNPKSLNDLKTAGMIGKDVNLDKFKYDPASGAISPK